MNQATGSVLHRNLLLGIIIASLCWVVWYMYVAFGCLSGVALVANMFVCSTCISLLQCNQL